MCLSECVFVFVCEVTYLAASSFVFVCVYTVQEEYLSVSKRLWSPVVWPKHSHIEPVRHSSIRRVSKSHLGSLTSRPITGEWAH